MALKPIASVNNELFEDAPVSPLTADVAAGVGAITVESIRDFAVNKILFIGELGQEKSEIVKTHTTTAPSGTTVTLASNLTFAHPIGTAVYIIDYDQIEFSHATTVDGVKTVITTIGIDPAVVDTVYKDSTYSSGYYFVRFKNSIDSTYSGYSDPIPYSGWSDNQVAKIIDYALKRNKLDTYTDNVTNEFCLQEINACLKYIHGKLKKWHSLQDFDHILGQTSRGVFKWTLPADIWQYSNKSILGVRIGTGKNLTYKDKTEWEEELEGVAHSELASGAAVGATSITLDNSNDFPESGTVMVKGQAITYTANNQSTGVLSGIPASGTGSITTTLNTDDDVWQGDYEEGEPEIFTVIDGYVQVWPLCDSSYVNLNVFMDYWKEAPSVDSDADEIDILRFDMVKFWLTWAIRAQVKNDGMRDQNDGDFVMFKDILSDAITKELQTHGQKYRLSPQLNKIKF
jgi:hypothetical protein